MRKLQIFRLGKVPFNSTLLLNEDVNLMDRGSIESIRLIEELIEWSNKNRVPCESEGRMFIKDCEGGVQINKLVNLVTEK